jgi:hypothetical protein
MSRSSILVVGVVRLTGLGLLSGGAVGAACDDIAAAVREAALLSGISEEVGEWRRPCTGSGSRRLAPSGGRRRTSWTPIRSPNTRRAYGIAVVKLADHLDGRNATGPLAPSRLLGAVSDAESGAALETLWGQAAVNT